MVRLGFFFPLLFLAPFLWRVFLLCLVLVFLVYLKNAFKYLQCVHVGERRGGRRNIRVCDLRSSRYPYFSPKAGFRHRFLQEAASETAPGKSPDTGGLLALCMYPFHGAVKEPTVSVLLQVLPHRIKYSESQHHVSPVHNFTFINIASGTQEMLQKPLLNESLMEIPRFGGVLPKYF